jgi:hypothetical protein
MYCYNENNNIIIELDHEYAESCEEVVAAIANSMVDFVELENEGYPVNLGNSYARYEFTALQDGIECEFAFGPIELDQLRRRNRIALHPLRGVLTHYERGEIAYKTLNENVWSKYPLDHDRDLFLWAEERLNKAVAEYDRLMDEGTMDEIEEAYEKAMDACRHMAQLFADRDAPTITPSLMLNLMVDMREVA